MSNLVTIRRLLLGATVAVLCVAPQAEVTEKIGEVPNATYLSGGVGDEEMSALRAKRSDYNTRFEFIETRPGDGRGQWTAGVEFQVKQNGQVVVDDRTDGPVLLLNLEPGTYELEADYNGETKSQTFEVREGRNNDHRINWRGTTEMDK